MWIMVVVVVQEAAAVACQYPEATDLQHPVLISPPDLHMQQLQLSRVVITDIPQNSQQQEQTEDLTEL